MAIKLITYNNLSYYPSELDLTGVIPDVISTNSVVNDQMNQTLGVSLGSLPRVLEYRTPNGEPIDRTKSYFYWVDAVTPSQKGTFQPSPSQAGIPDNAINITFPKALDGRTINAYIMVYEYNDDPTTAMATFEGANATASTDEGTLPIELPIGESRTFTITPNAGHEFVNGGTYNGNPITNIVDGVASFTTTITEDIHIVMNATVKPRPSTYDVTFKGTNCTATVEQNDGVGGRITKDLPYNEKVALDTNSYYTTTFTLTTNEGYEFTQTGLYGDIPITNINFSKNIAWLEVNTISGDADLAMDATSKTLNTETITLLSDNVLVSSEVSDGVGGKIYYNYPYLADTQVPRGGSHLFTIRAKQGYVITSESYYDDTLITDITPDGTVATFVTEMDRSFTISISTDRSEVDVTGFNRIYQLTSDELADFATQRFTTDQDLDLGQFIINVLKVPFQVPSIYVGERETIRLGNYEVNTVADRLKNDEITIDVGTVHVPSVYHNSYDYLDTEAILHLPYGDDVKLDLNYVIDHDITLKYYLNVYTGSTTINITSSKVGEVIQSISVNIGVSVPFITYMNDLKNDLKKDFINNKLTQAYIEIIRNHQQNIENPYHDVVSVQGKLEDVTGFITVDDIQLVTNATASEIDSIRSKLREGVVING